MCDRAVFIRVGSETTEIDSYSLLSFFYLSPFYSSRSDARREDFLFLRSHNDVTKMIWCHDESVARVVSGKAGCVALGSLSLMSLSDVTG